MLTQEKLTEMESYGQTRDSDWSEDEFRELFRLARLGVWARDFAIPLLKESSTDISELLEADRRKARELAALPKAAQ